MLLAEPPYYTWFSLAKLPVLKHKDPFPMKHLLDRSAATHQGCRNAFLPKDLAAFRLRQLVSRDLGAALVVPTCHMQDEGHFAPILPGWSHRSGRGKLSI